MDKLYKPLFLRLAREGMARSFPDFSPARIARGQPNADVFAGSLLYCVVARPGHTVWIGWQPGPGLERRFEVLVGWSPSPDTLPVHDGHDPRIYSLRSPTQDYPACSLSLEQVLGRSAIGGFAIPTPWDRVYRLKPNAPGAEHKRVMDQASAEAAALTPEDRLAAIRGIMDEVFAHLLSVIPAFRMPAGQGHG